MISTAPVRNGKENCAPNCLRLHGTHDTVINGAPLAIVPGRKASANLPFLSRRSLAIASNPCAPLSFDWSKSRNSRLNSPDKRAAVAQLTDFGLQNAETQLRAQANERADAVCGANSGGRTGNLQPSTGGANRTAWQRFKHRTVSWSSSRWRPHCS